MPSSTPVPEPIARLAAIMAGFDGTWLLCGGWAIDAWLGRQTRDHVDIDLGVFEDELEQVARHFAGWRLIAHDETDPDSTEPWDRRRLTLPAHIHTRREGEPELDIQICERSGSEWILNRRPRVAIEIGRCSVMTDWDVPALLPEVALYFKALEMRQQDMQDFDTVLPHLGQRTGELAS